MYDNVKKRMNPFGTSDVVNISNDVYIFCLED